MLPGEHIMNEIWIDTPKGKIFGMTAGKPSATAGEPSRPVVGIHGFSQRNGWHTWEPLARPLAEAGFYVVLVDMPGWGKSPAWGEGALNGREAVMAILDGLQLKEASLLGKSWGGGIVLDVAMHHPDRIHKVVLTAPAYRGDFMELDRLTMPVLMAWAKDDEVIPYTYATMFTGAIPNCRLETYDTGGHSAAQKNADDFAPKAVEFLRG